MVGSTVILGRGLWKFLAASSTTMESLPLKKLDFGLQKPTGPSSGVVASIVLIIIALSSVQCCQLSGISFHTEMSSFPDFQLHFRIFFVRCLALSFDIPAAVGSKSEGVRPWRQEHSPVLVLVSLYRIFYHYIVMYRKLLLFYCDYRLYDDRWQIKLSPSLLLFLTIRTLSPFS